MKVTIKGVEYVIKYGFRSLFVFERLTGRAFESTTLDMCTLFYATLMANNPAFAMDFEEFINLLDEEPRLLDTFRECLTTYDKRLQVFEDSEADKKKVDE